MYVGNMVYMYMYIQNVCAVYSSPYPAYCVLCTFYGVYMYMYMSIHTFCKCMYMYMCIYACT